MAIAEVARDTTGNTIVTYGHERYFVAANYSATDSTVFTVVALKEGGGVVGCVGRYRNGYAPIPVESLNLWTYDPSMFLFFQTFEAAVAALLEEVK